MRRHTSGPPFGPADGDNAGTLQTQHRTVRISDPCQHQLLQRCLKFCPAAGQPDEARSSSDASSGGHFSISRCGDGGGGHGGGGSNGGGAGSPPDRSDSEEAYMSFNKPAAHGVPVHSRR